MEPPAITLILSPDITPYKKSRAPNTIKKGMTNFFIKSPATKNLIDITLISTAPV
jgi:hypothetical protein